MPRTTVKMLHFIGALTISLCFTASTQLLANATSETATEKPGKPVVYQVFTRLFGNQNTTNKAWGTIEENGVGKFSDFTDEALLGIKEFGTTHIWYTGVPHHAVINDYSAYGIKGDDPDVVKGRAGSPYAVKDYYNVNPDLADDPAKRLQEFKALIERTHKHGMQVIIDIVPNHVARNYQSLSKPKGVEDFGASDDTSVEYQRDNNFYYIVGEDFKVPAPLDGYQPLGGDTHPLADGKFHESPAKWTGNGSRKAQPHFHDWYETVKVNYGVKPDGSFDFPRLPESYRTKGTEQHLAFWQDKDLPDSWYKFRDIVLYWTELGVDGFRFDMAEMVPVEFWSFLNSSIKQANPDAFLLAEVYNPAIYRDYLALGKMDYLYDKVDLYDTLKLIMQGKASTDAITPIVERYADIDQHLLHFLENHDEQRIASSGFAGDANKGMPAMVVSTLLGKGPTMLYFAQALGEAAEDKDPGFGDVTRTSIFDYWGVASLQRWANQGKYDGGQLTKQERNLRNFYTKLLRFSANSSAVNGEFFDLQNPNSSVYSFARTSDKQQLVVVSNFSDKHQAQFELQLPSALIKQWQLTDGNYFLGNVLELPSSTKQQFKLNVVNGKGKIAIQLNPLESVVLELNKRPSTASSNVQVLTNAFTMDALNRERTVRIYLPPDYQHSDKAYPVLYMHDGQNLFDDASSYVGEWGIDETLNGLYQQHGFNLIVVGIDHGNDKRVSELSSWNNKHIAAAEGEQYMRFIVKQLKPYIDKHYRTLSDRNNTAIMGSSMGGLMSHYGLFAYPDVFSKAGIFSPAYWITPEIFEYSQTKQLLNNSKLYILMGDAEGEQMVSNYQKMVKQLTEQGLTAEQMQAKLIAKGKHNEGFWRAHFEAAIKFLFKL